MRKIAPAIDSQSTSACCDAKRWHDRRSGHGDIIVRCLQPAACSRALAALLVLACCRRVRIRRATDPRRRKQRDVENQTSRDWRNVVITVNDHYRGGAPTLLPGGRLTAPLSQFQTGFGQQVRSRHGQSVFKVEVTGDRTAERQAGRS